MHRVRVDLTLSTPTPVSEQKGEYLREYVEILGDEIGMKLTRTNIKKEAANEDGNG